MPRRRWLPENVTTYRDRHGKARYRFRKKGLPSYTFRHAPGTQDFMAEYEAARQGEHNKRTSEHIHRSNVERWLVKELGESYVR